MSTPDKLFAFDVNEPFAEVLVSELSESFGKGFEMLDDDAVIPYCGKVSFADVLLLSP